ncbi:MAG: prohibitin family protein [Candidatus Moranbacteria bacterium]|nr:prohibitin family protein [Candidatus Moranbacteria bacterium]
MDIRNFFKNRKNLLPLIVGIFLLSSILGKNFFWLIIIALIIGFIFKNFINKLLKKDMDYNNKNIKDAITDVTGKGKKFLLGAVLVILTLFLLINSIKIIEAGETGVYSLFGKVREQELSSGIHLVNPLARITKMSIRTEEYTMSVAQEEGRKKGVDSITALTKEGLNIDLDITILYRLNEQEAAKVYKNVGLDYDEKIIRPAIRSTIREVVATYNTKDIYSEKRQEASSNIFKTLEVKVEPRGIVLEDVLLRNVNLPANLAKSIQDKLQAEQEAQKYDFILAREKKEKERKIIEAEGQRDAQQIINESLTQNYLNYLYINNLENREGTIYVPTNPATGLPVFFQGGQG